MRLTHSFKGVSESGNYTPIPNGVYHLRITDVQDGTTRNGDPMANVKLTVIEGPFTGKNVYHNVSFLPKENEGAGIAKHFLHVIGEPYDDDEVDIDTDRWFEKVVKAEVAIANYTNKKGEKRTKNDIERFILNEDGNASKMAATAGKDEDGPLPF